MKTTKWIIFKDVPFYGKTKRWEVLAKGTENNLGRIMWDTGWRRYIFAPAFPTIFDVECLRDIALFIEDEMKLYRQKV